MPAFSLTFSSLASSFPIVSARCVAILLVAAALGTSRPVAASTIPGRSDAELVALSDRVVHAIVTAVRGERDAQGRIYTVVQLAVVEDLTGWVDPVLEIRELGGSVGTEAQFVSGGARFEVGQEIVVCLERTATGSFRTVALAYSKWDVVGSASDPLLIRELDGRHVAGPSTAPAPTTLGEFRQTVAEITGATPVRPAGAPAVPGPSRSTTPGPPAFTLLATPPIRWHEADAGTPITWYRNSAAPAPLANGGSGDAEIAAGLAAWTDVPAASLVLQFGGALNLGPVGGGCSPAIGAAGHVSFEEDLPAGVLAIGGGCYVLTGKSVSGRTFYGFVGGFVAVQRRAQLGASFTAPLNLSRVLEHEIGHGIGLGHSDAGPSNIMYASCCDNSTPVPPALGPDDEAGLSFIYPASAPPPPPADADGDGLPDAWERQVGLSPASAAGDDGAGGNPDGDALSNAEEYARGYHPRGFFKRYFAEGSARSLFTTSFALVNPSRSSSVSVVLHFDRADGGSANQVVTLPPSSRRTVEARTVPFLDGTDFATLVESDALVVADRTMIWDDRGYGSHAETSIAAPSTIWYLAEGATHSGFNLFYLVQNASPLRAGLDVTYLLPGGRPPIVKRYVVEANSRLTIWVNAEAQVQLPQLANTDVSAIVRSTNDVPVIVERAMYLDAGGLAFGAGHESAGIAAPASTWFLAEGATGDYFDLFVLIANPGAMPAAVDVQYLLPGGGVVRKTHVVPASSRYTIWVDREDARLADTAVSVVVTARDSRQIIVERAMWWPGPTAATWHEAHNSAGSVVTGPRWAMAEGEQGGPRGAETYVLLANTSPIAGTVRATLLFEDGGAAVTELSVAASSRVNLAIGDRFPSAADRRFGVLVEALNGVELIVERAIYHDAGGQRWAAGSNALATRLP